MSAYGERILVLAPTENDSRIAVSVLCEAGLQAEVSLSIELMCEQIAQGCAVIVIAEEALPEDQLHLLQNCLQEQSPWSDLPVILLTGQGPAKSWESFSASGNISLLERPFSRLTLVRAVEVGLRARRKQYLVCHLLEQQKQAAQRRDEFFATLSHELRTPLNVILGWTEILRTGELNREEELDALNILERNAQVQKSLIDDLLDTSRIITGKLHFELSPISLSKLLISARKAFAPRAEQKDIYLELQIPEEECVVMADEPRLSQVITNLLTNAIKFTPDKGRILVRLKKVGREYQVSVKDNGQGIESSFLPYVFDRLKQEDMSTTRRHGGLGLGLAISAYIVEQHKGKIEVKSEGRGKGAEFTLSLPVLNESAESQITLMKPHHTNSLAGVRVLVVDDSRDILTLISLWLKKTDAQVKLVASAPEALRALSEYQPDVLLSDIGMPEMDGYQLINEVRKHSLAAVRNVHAIALTAYAKDEERAKALDAGFQMHISKPISSDQLLAAVYSVTSSKTLH